MDTIPHLVLRNAERRAGEPAFIHRSARTWHTTTWGEYGRTVRSAARALLAAGVRPGERVALLSYNTPQWVAFDVAAMAIGAVPVGIYFAAAPDEVNELIERSGTRVLLAGSAGHVEILDRARHPRLDLVICVDAEPEGSVSWGAFLESGSKGSDTALDRRIAALAASDPATMIFTAAGHGAPSGVVLTHDNLSFTAKASVDLFEITGDDNALSYLPLSHIAEQIFTILAPAHAGYPVAFAESIGRIRVDLPDIQPSIFFGVPLVWRGFEQAARKHLDRLDGRQRKAAAWAMRVSRRHRAALDAGRRPGPLLRSEMALARLVFTDRAKEAMGLSRARSVFSGAAPTDASLIDFFAGFDVPIRQVYGLSEATGPACVTRRGADRHGSVGFPLPGVAISLADDGEVLIRGRSVFSHYLGDTETTARTLRGGWLHTGDLGVLGDDGQLTIVGRKKDVVITTGGKNVCSGALESLLRSDDAIVDAVVVGDGRDQLGVLLAVDESMLTRGEDVLERARRVVDAVNRRFARAEQIRRVGLLPRRLSVEQGERETSGRVVRRVALDHFAASIEDLYR